MMERGGKYRGLKLQIRRNPVKLVGGAGSTGGTGGGGRRELEGNGGSKRKLRGKINIDIINMI